MQRTSNRGTRGRLLGHNHLGLIRDLIRGLIKDPIKGPIRGPIRDLDTLVEGILLFLAHDF